MAARRNRWYRRLLGFYASELVVIFLGITFSFWFNQWLAHRDERRREYTTLQKFYVDVERKMLEGINDRKDFVQFKADTDTLLHLLYGHMPYDEAQTFRCFASLFSGNHFFENKTAHYISTINNAQAMGSMRNQQLLLSIIDYYENTLYFAGLSYNKYDDFHQGPQKDFLRGIPRDYDTAKKTYPIRIAALRQQPALANLVHEQRGYNQNCIAALDAVETASKNLLLAIAEELKHLEAYKPS